MARDVSLLAVLDDAVAGCVVERGAGDGSAVTALVLRAGLTGVGGSAEGWDWREVRLAATGAEEVSVVTELGVLVTLGVVTLTGAGVLLTAVALADAASFALFSFLILSISSSSLAAAGRDGVTTAGLGAAGLGAGGGVSFFLGLVNSISLSFAIIDDG